MSFKEKLEQARTHLSQENYRDAMAIYQGILAEDPNHAIALQAMGQIAQTVKNLEAAEDYFQRSLAQNAGQFNIWIKLGEVLSQTRKHEKSIQAFRNAVQVEPNKSEGYLKLGNALLVAGEKDEAEATLEKAFMLDENAPSAFRLIATSFKLTSGGALAREAQKRIDAGAGSKVGRAHLHYGLAYIYEKEGDAHAFFDHLHEANRLQKESAPNWRMVYEQNAREIKKAFKPETFAKTVGPEARQYTPIFIVGMPRSGTTLTEQIVSAHPKVFGADEMDILAHSVVNRVAVWTGKPYLIGINDLASNQLGELSAVYQGMMQRLCPGYPFITDKFLANYMCIGLIRLIMPWARVINLQRNPMDNALSIYKNFFVNYLPFCFNLEDMANYYHLYRDLMTFWDDLLPGFVHHVKYENLVGNFEDEARKIIDFCGLEWDEACLAPHENKRTVLTLSQDQVRKPVYTSSVGRWKKYEKDLEPFRRIIEDYGYDPEE